MDEIFIVKTLEKINDFALKNNFKKEIQKHLPNEFRRSEKWKINLYQNHIPRSTKKPLDIMLNTNLFSEREKDLIKAIIGGFIASFEVLANNGELKVYNFINEKEYIVYPVKPEVFKVNQAKFFISMMITFEDNNYILDVVENVKIKKSANALAKEILIKDSSILYRDNPKKEEELKVLLDKIYLEFTNIFKTNKFLIKSDMESTVSNWFLDVVKSGNKESRDNLINVLKNKFKEEGSIAKIIDLSDTEIDIEEIDEKLPNTCFFVLKDKGVYFAKYYSVLEKIYETGDFTFIYENTDILQNYFVEDVLDYPAEAIFYLYNEAEDKEKFLDITRNIIRKVSQDYEFTNAPDINTLNLYELLDFFKDNYDCSLKTLSIYTLQLASKSISELIEEIEDVITKFEELFEKEKPFFEDDEELSKIGRNDPCYCGSGKKYKKCCMKYN